MPPTLFKTNGVWKTALKVKPLKGEISPNNKCWYYKEDCPGIVQVRIISWQSENKCYSILWNNVDVK